MNPLQRARLYLTRKKTKTVLLCISLTVISLLLMLCIALGDAIDTSVQRLYESMGGYFKVETNTENGFHDYVSDDMVNEIMKNNAIIEYNGITITKLAVNDAQLYPGKFTMEGKSMTNIARISGNTDSSLNENFVLGTLELAEGRHITADDSGKAVVSEDFAERNDLSLSDKFAIQYPDEELDNETASEINLHTVEIVGIYNIVENQIRDDSNTAESDILENYIFVDTAVIRDIIQQATNRQIASYSDGVMFFVNDPKQMNRVINSLADISGYDWNGYTVTKVNSTYESMEGSLTRLSGIVTLLVYIILVISAAILSLMLLLWMKERKYEIGVMLSLGFSKANIIAQHICENVMVTVIAFILGGIICVSASKPVSNSINSTVLSQADSIEEEQAEAYVEINIDAIEIGKIFTLEVLVVALSTGIASVPVLRTNPKNIFSQL